MIPIKILCLSAAVMAAGWSIYTVYRNNRKNVLWAILWDVSVVALLNWYLFFYLD